MLFRRPLHEVWLWPASDLSLIETYLAHQPSPEERIEIAIANLHATYINAHLRKGAPTVKVKALLPYLDPWRAAEEAARYSELDREFLEAFSQ